MGGFSTVFGGGVLNPSDVAQRTVALSADVTLAWPFDSTSATDYVARIMDVTASTTSLAITMPPANQVSTGTNILFTNPGSNAYDVLDNDGGVIVSVTAGQEVMIYITVNTTTAGTWNTFLFGAGSSALTAASVVGYGLKAISNTLNAASPLTEVAINTTIATSDRASTYVWTGGAGTFTLLAAATATNDFFFSLRNEGTGALTVSPQGGETIDGESSIVLQVGESCEIHAGVSLDWFTIGRGRSTQFSFTQLVKTVTGGTDTLTQTEAANVVQKYIGTLLSAETIVVPAVVQVYYVSNQTSGAYSFTVQSPTPGTTVSISSGQNAILFSDGVNIINASTSIAGISSLTLNTASAAAPSLNFSGNTTTGLFQPATGSIGFSSSGTEVGRTTQYGYNAIAGSAAHPSYAFTASATTGMYSAGANQINFANNGVLSFSLSATGAATFASTVAGGTYNKVTITAPATGSTLTIADGKTFTNSNTLTLTATDGSTLAIGAGGTLGSAAYTASSAYATVNQVHFVGTTSIAANRASASQALTGITSIDGSAATLTTPRAIYGNNFDGSAALTSAIAVQYGGTGLATLTANNVILGNGASSPTFVAPGTSGNVLVSNGTTWGSSAPAAATLPRSARTSNTILAATDNAKRIDITSGTFSQTFTAAATLGSGWFCYIGNSGTGNITLDPNGSETIDGFTSYVMYPGELRLVQCDGSAFYSVVIQRFYHSATANATFTKPPGYKLFGVLAIGGGGSGGSGGGGGSGSGSGTAGGGGGSGGGSGGNGAAEQRTIMASIMAATDAIVVGTGGALTAGVSGGAGVSSATASGNNGTIGSTGNTGNTSSFASGTIYAVSAVGGTGGVGGGVGKLGNNTSSGGTTAGVSGGAAVSANQIALNFVMDSVGTVGGTSVAGAAGVNSTSGGSGGDGGISPAALLSATTVAGGTGGATQSTAAPAVGNSGNPGSTGASPGQGGSGGGAGSGSRGGAGGAASGNGGASGAGGAGADGRVDIWGIV